MHLPPRDIVTRLVFFLSYFRNKTSLVLRQTVESAVVNRGVLDLCNMLFDVTSALAVMEKESTSVGMATEIWLELLERTPRTSPVLPFIKERATAALDSPVFLLGNVQAFSRHFFAFFLE